MPSRTAHLFQPPSGATFPAGEWCLLDFFQGITMKIKEIAAACLWLPGFAPEEDPNIGRGLFRDQPSSFAMSEVVPVAMRTVPAPAKPQWPRLVAEVHAPLGGSVAKFEANVEALKLLQQLESEDRDPTPREREVLNRYTGWGGLPQAFNEAQNDTAWRERAMMLKTVMSAEEHASAMASTTDSHYTPVEVIEAMWSMVERLGFTGGRVLDPSTGTGFFLGAMPVELSSASTVTAVEVDSISARIAKKLYRQYGARILNKGFEASNLPAGHFDLAITNCPFGQMKVAELRNVPFANYSIHNYFIARSLEMVRPGGLVVMLTSSYTMDSHRSGPRAYFAGQADLVGAIRLPSSTFHKMANTSVTTDIIILQKRSERASSEPNWIDSLALPSGSPINGSPYYSKGQLVINQWFGANPEMVIGKLTSEQVQQGTRVVCKFEGDLEVALQERIELLPKGIYAPKPESQLKQHVKSVRLDTETRSGLALIDGKVFEVDGDIATPVQASEKVLARIKGMIGIRDAARCLIAAQVQNSSDAMLGVYRTALSVAYDTFVAEWGYLTDKANRVAFKADPDLPLLLSLESRDETTNTVEKAAIFTQRTVGAAKKVSRCESMQDALQVTLAETGRVVPSRIAGLVGKEVEDAMRELEESGGVFLDPTTMNWVVADAYLSGNVREKLEVAKDSGERFVRNVEALEKAVPKLLTPAEITPRIGATWIPAKVYAQFLDEILKVGPNVNHEVDVDLSVGAWTVKTPWSVEYSVAATSNFGTSKVTCGRLVELALNQQEPTVFVKSSDGKQVASTVETIAAREKQYLIKEEFKKWLWADAQRAETLADAYNRMFNSWVVRRFNGEHLVLPGMSQAFTLRPHQKDAVWRCLSSDSNVLLAHAVGAGKTLEMICTAMELRRVGKASKPMMCVPNHLLDQCAQEFMQAYPGAKILMATKEDLQGDKRRTLLSRIATGDWDCVIITHSSFERIPIGGDYLKGHIEAEIDKVETALRQRIGDSKSNRIVKQLARAKKNWEARLKQLSGERKKDDVLTFDQLGVDYLLVDECHLYKNCYRFSQMQRIAGLPNTDSQRAFDMLVKSRYINQVRGDGTGLVFCTGTYISNSMAEQYVMMRYLQEPALEASGIANFDAWAGNFGEVVTSLELAPDGGGYRPVARFARFLNLPELMSIFRQVADIKTAEMLNLPVPKAKRETITAKGSDGLKAYVNQLVERAQKIRDGRVKPSVDNMLAVTGDGRKAALDMQLVDTFAECAEGGKISLCAQGVYDKWVASSSFNGTQLVFCDLSTPRKDGRFDAYNDLRDKLIAKGIPSAQIAFIHDYETDAAKAALFRDVRAGVIRVLMGSTAKMGVGTNVQDRLYALWHLDVPWRPSDLEQREGRILRQGNMCEEVYIFYMLTEGSFDAYSYQVLDAKQSFIGQVMRGDTSLRTLDEDSQVLTYAEIKAIASGNPLVLRKAGVDSELAKLTMLYEKWSRDRWSNQYSLERMPAMINATRQKIAQLNADAATVANHPDDSFAFTVNGIGTVSAEKAAAHFKKIIQALPRNSGEVEMCVFKGLRVCAERDETASLEVWLAGEGVYELDNDISWQGIVGEVIRLAMKMEHSAAHAAQRLEMQLKHQKELAAEVENDFDKLERLEELRRMKIELDTLLDLSKGEMTAVEETEDSVETAEA